MKALIIPAGAVFKFTVSHRLTVSNCASFKQSLTEGVDDDNGADVVVDALVDGIHFFLQLISEPELVIEPGFMGFFLCGEATKIALLSCNRVVALSHIFSSFPREVNPNRKLTPQCSAVCGEGV